MNRAKILFSITFIALAVIGAGISLALAGTLVCNVTSTCNLPSVIVLRMASTTNSHAELPYLSSYPNLVCCTNVTGLGNSCAGTFATVLKLSSSTNAHVEESSQTNYPTSTCLSVAGGSVSVGYQQNNCSGFDATLVSISTTTNAHVSVSSTYATQVCATAASSGNVAPSISSIFLNHGNPITLTPDATTSIDINYKVTDNDGCTDVVNTTSTAFLGGVSQTCAVPSPVANNLSCYVSVTHTTSTCASNSFNVTDTVQLYYFARSSGNASSSYPSDHWYAYASAVDASNATGTATSSAVDVNVLLALNVMTSTINYGTVSASSTTGAMDQVIITQNVGNASQTISIYGTALTLGANVIATSSQHYASSSFTYGGIEQSLQQSATTVPGVTISPHIDLAPLTQAWRTAGALPGVIANHGGATYNGYLYTTGGFDGTNLTSSVFYALITGNATVGAWAATTPLLNKLDYHSSVAYNGYLYTVGGYDNANITSTVYYAPLSTNGTVGAWAPTTPLPNKLAYSAAAVWNGYLYTTGGSPDGSNATTTVYYAPLSTNGTVGAWATANPLPSAIGNLSSAVYNGYLYTIGGYDGVGATSTVFYAPINATGSVGIWTQGTALPASLDYQASVAMDGNLYVTGGLISGSALTSQVLYASLAANGALGSWTAASSLPSTLYTHSTVAANGALYTIGGSPNGVSATSSVFSTATNARSIYWGIGIPAGSVTGTYSGTNTFTAIFIP